MRCQVEEVEVAGLAEAVNVWNEQGQQSRRTPRLLVSA